ncbi:hypothetical protein CEXT_224541 [Caerostris extrusa]|uniref:Uncharacterized protein n=1 Tax=Caerostris extrusa TaxID=172846 RepID=A0AAV4M725_CAEEX|nr:hypothetical protein CEXT_224541 [Caerostris extrusa]
MMLLKIFNKKSIVDEMICCHYQPNLLVYGLVSLMPYRILPAVCIFHTVTIPRPVFTDARPQIEMSESIPLSHSAATCTPSRESHLKSTSHTSARRSCVQVAWVQHPRTQNIQLCNIVCLMWCTYLHVCSLCVNKAVISLRLISITQPGCPLYIHTNIDTPFTKERMALNRSFS